MARLQPWDGFNSLDYTHVLIQKNVYILMNVQKKIIFTIITELSEKKKHFMLSSISFTVHLPLSFLFQRFIVVSNPSILPTALIIFVLKQKPLIKAIFTLQQVLQIVKLSFSTHIIKKQCRQIDIQFAIVIFIQNKITISSKNYS